MNSDATDGIHNLYKLDKTNGTILQTIPLPGTGTRGVTFAQGRLYIDDYSLDNIYVYDFVSETWSVAFEMPVPPGGGASNRYCDRNDVGRIQPVGREQHVRVRLPHADDPHGSGAEVDTRLRTSGTPRSRA